MTRLFQQGIESPELVCAVAVCNETLIRQINVEALLVSHQIPFQCFEVPHHRNIQHSSALTESHIDFFGGKIDPLSNRLSSRDPVESSRFGRRHLLLLHEVSQFRDMRLPVFAKRSSIETLFLGTSPVESLEFVQRYSLLMHNLLQLRRIHLPVPAKQFLHTIEDFILFV